MSSRKPKQRDDDVQQKQTRIAIINEDKCKPKKCRQGQVNIILTIYR